MSHSSTILIACVLLAACGSSDKALRSPGTGNPIVVVGAAGSAPANPLPPVTGIAGQIAQPEGAGIGGTQTAVTNPFGVAGAGSSPLPSPPIGFGAAGSGF